MDIGSFQKGSLPRTKPKQKCMECKFEKEERRGKDMELEKEEGKDGERRKTKRRKINQLQPTFEKYGAKETCTSYKV